MKLISYLIAVLLMALLVTSCASDISARNAKHHASAADAASKTGDWTTARKQWAQALVNAQLAGAPAQQLAVFNYEYGRVLGVLCFWDESEKYLLKAYQLDHETGGPEFMSLLELSRLKYDQKQYDKSVPYYERAIEALDKVNAPTEAPAEFCVVLDEYAKALLGSGKKEESSSVHTRANEIRSKNPGRQSITDRTPYGAQCASKRF
mgnify:CR=1 FL=1